MIYLKLEPYIAQWLVHEHGNPVEFPRNSAENDVIELALTTLPDGTAPNLPSEGTVAIKIPTFKYKDVRDNNYLPQKGQNSLRACIRARFSLQLWKELQKFGYIGEQKQDLIYAWMQAHGIEPDETNFNTIAKIYMRKRNAYIQRFCRKKRKK